ncbi:NAD(P)-dependent alcohol dehydrogenase [Glaciihabitans arcticus]|uniref:NAD(P)-dependent alcohol dehydrogenase n=1 Tax=Glaciihabitans arcticus TaxID=2668039 RepID=A0A4Q9GQR8_9MICO|nr:NAD(P)-dependent alcohol dehydrogenase [Glaciihabitans arcticus]TBN57222.1 NAD(P)-dependent alcohol dehydrogenase [Glaciihabitans arcticus]
MKAITYDTYGGPEVLVVDDVPTPEPADHQVLIRVRAAALNPYDWHFYRGDPYLARMGGQGLRRPKQKNIIGADVAGDVISVGSAVTTLKPGDAVFGGIGRGACAEFAATSHKNLVLKPASVSYEDAAASPMGALTALYGLRQYGSLSGKTVLVNGASGGVGHFAVQIARALGASRVVAVCSGVNADWVRDLGADDVIDYTARDFTRMGERFDVIFDTVGTQPLRALRRALVPGGTFITVGAIGGGKLLGPATFMFGSLIAGAFVREKVAVLMDWTATPDDYVLLAGWLADGTVRSHVDLTYRLEETADAARHLETGHVRGKVVVTQKQS